MPKSFLIKNLSNKSINSINNNSMNNNINNLHNEGPVGKSWYIFFLNSFFKSFKLV
jgi:hypothetical protein